jgi:S1-C subfamily serine protease
MEDIILLEAVERYIRGEMTTEEKKYFEHTHKTNPELDQLVVEHTMFLQQLEHYGEDKAFRNNLHNVYHQLLQEGAIKVEELTPGNKVINIFRKYRRTIAIAASIAGIVALTTSALVSYYNSNKSNSDIIELKKVVDGIKKDQKVISNTIANNAANNNRPVAAEKTNGTGFLIDGKGYIITNAHVIKKADSVYVESNSGLYYKAAISYIDRVSDLAILKIDDKRFKPIDRLPYAIKRSSVDLGEQIYTLGFPREEIVYGEGYLSAITGYNGDTVSCQITIPANPGNSGGPVINTNGEVIGVLSEKQARADGVVFAIKSNSIYKAAEELKKQEEHKDLKLSTFTRIKGMERVQQIKKVADCVFIVKSY